ncbi:uncharacterized protein [Porites lutea]|uniref:uncharacterized protein n=1 Tax=Porites lutea TaxID=51062 RepID=UPI003CC6538F
MKSMFLFAFGVFAVFQTAYSIQCYFCEGGQSDCTKERMDGKKDIFLPTCGSDYDRCVRVSTKIDDVKGVILSCSSASDCESREERCKTWTLKGTSCKVDCCQTDGCNGAYLVNYSAYLLAVCIFIGLWL